MYKIFHNIFPDYIINSFNISATTKIRETRQTSKLAYKIPLAKTLNERHSSFRGPTMWNDIPNDFKLVKYFRLFRLQKNYLIDHPHILKNLIFPLVCCSCVVARLFCSYVLFMCAYVLWICLHRLCRYM